MDFLLLICFTISLQFVLQETVNKAHYLEWRAMTWFSKDSHRERLKMPTISINYRNTRAEPFSPCFMFKGLSGTLDGDGLLNHTGEK